MSDTEPDVARKQPMVRFSPVIQAGQLIQAGVALILGMGAIVVWLFSNWLSIDERITTEKTQRALLAQRVEQSERASTEAREAVRTLAANVDQKLDRISNQIGDLRQQAGSSSARR